MRNMDNQELIRATGEILIGAINQMPEPQQKVTAAVSASFNYVTATTALLMGRQFDSENNKYPTNDHCLLTLFMIHEMASMNSDASVRVEFSPHRMFEALEDFKRFTGRDGEHLLDSNLLAAMKQATAYNRDSFGNNSKFLPPQ